MSDESNESKPLQKLSQMQMPNIGKNSQNGKAKQPITAQQLGTPSFQSLDGKPN